MSKLTKLLKQEKKLSNKIYKLDRKIFSSDYVDVAYLDAKQKSLESYLVDIRKELKDLLIIELARLIQQ